MSSTITEPDTELLTRVTALLNALGPFPQGATRAEKWRTTDQLANELKLFGRDAVNRLDQVLRKHEVQGLELLEKGMAPERVVRRAKYPDRTTALPMWGSTKYHGQPWSGHRPDRSDPAEDLPQRLAVPAGMPHVFLSHTHDDASVALRLAEEMAAMSIGSWRFESDIEQHGDIADCVRKAINEADALVALVALVSRSSIASLWVLTELHTALHGEKTVMLVVDASDPLLLQLLETARFPHPDEDFDLSVEYDHRIEQILKQDYGRRHPESRTERYDAQVRDFMATLPRYLGSLSSNNHRVWRSIFALPNLPTLWSGFLKLESLSNLPGRLEKHPVHH
jgi:hypothetical protein